MHFLFIIIISFLTTSCSNHFLRALSLSMGLQSSVGKWKMVSPHHLFHEAKGLVLFHLSSSPVMGVLCDSTWQYAPLKCTRAPKHPIQKCVLHKSIFTSRSAYAGLSPVSRSSPFLSQPFSLPRNAIQMLGFSSKAISKLQIQIPTCPGGC